MGRVENENALLNPTKPGSHPLRLRFTHKHYWFCILLLMLQVNLGMLG